MPDILWPMLDQMGLCHQRVCVDCFVLSEKPDSHQSVQEQFQGTCVGTKLFSEFRRAASLTVEQRKDV